MNNLFSKRNIFIFILLAVLAVSIFLIARSGKVPLVLSTDPANNTQEIIENSQINILFNEDIKENAKNNISVEINPQIEIDSTWLTNNYKVIPKKQFENNKKYYIQKWNGEVGKETKISKLGIHTRDNEAYAIRMWRNKK